MYVHLRRRLSHADGEGGCKEERCAADCGFMRFDEWMDDPVTPWDIRRRERERAVIAALKRGVVPV